MSEPSPKPPSLQEALQLLRQAALCRQIRIHPRCQDNVQWFQLDAESVCEILAEADTEEVVKSEPDYDKTRFDWIIVLKIAMEIDGVEVPLYFKVALHRPEMTSGYLLSLRPF